MFMKYNVLFQHTYVYDYQPELSAFLSPYHFLEAFEFLSSSFHKYKIGC